MTPEEFWDNVQVGQPDECWPWLRCRVTDSYGRVRWNGATTGTHVVAFEIVNGYKPDECVCHECDNRICCNPWHLWDGTKGDNHRDMVAKGRQVVTQRHGEDCPGVKLTQRKVDTMRAFAAIGMFNKSELARIHGLNPSTARRIVNGQAWKRTASSLINQFGNR